MVILQNATTVYGFDEEKVIEWYFSTINETYTATLLFENGYKRSLTDDDAFQALQIFNQLFGKEKD